MSRRFILGRADAGKADILLPGKTISARHAELIVAPGGDLLLRDLSSSNGTLIRRNGRKMDIGATAVSLSSDDLILFGGVEFTIDELLSKIPADNRSAQAPAAKPAGERKMVRCPSCGSVTPAGGPCIECGYIG